MQRLKENGSQSPRSRVLVSLLKGDYAMPDKDEYVSQSPRSRVLVSLIGKTDIVKHITQELVSIPSKSGLSFSRPRTAEHVGIIIENLSQSPRSRVLVSLTAPISGIIEKRGEGLNPLEVGS